MSQQKTQTNNQELFLLAGCVSREKKCVSLTNFNQARLFSSRWSYCE